MIKKPKLTFQDRLDKYKRYNPATEGFGNVNQWRSAFNDRMTGEEAVKVLQQKDPLSILGLTEMPTLDVLKQIYRKLMMTNHPDRGGDEEKAKEIIAAYTILKDKLSQ